MKQTIFLKMARNKRKLAKLHKNIYRLYFNHLNQDHLSGLFKLIQLQIRLSKQQPKKFRVNPKMKKMIFILKDDTRK